LKMDMRPISVTGIQTMRQRIRSSRHTMEGDEVMVYLDSNHRD
jgi:hypothetical protein